jgi:hypothetical protein
MVYNRSTTRVDEFKTYASECQLAEGDYIVAEDLKVIGEKWVFCLFPSSFYLSSYHPPDCSTSGANGSSSKDTPLTIRADIVVTSLSSDEAVEEVYQDLFNGQEVCISYLKLVHGG